MKLEGMDELAAGLGRAAQSLDGFSKGANKAGTGMMRFGLRLVGGIVLVVAGILLLGVAAMTGMMMIGLGAILFMLGVISMQIGSLKEQNALISGGLTILFLIAAGIGGFLGYVGLVMVAAKI